MFNLIYIYCKMFSFFQPLIGQLESRCLLKLMIYFNLLELLTA